jgi:hypothetical protein
MNSSAVSMRLFALLLLLIQPQPKYPVLLVALVAMLAPDLVLTAINSSIPITVFVV